MDKNELLKQVKRTVQSFDPKAKVILYGSRARGDAFPDSDWDFLVLLNVAVDWRLKEAIRHALYRVELASDEVISSIIHDESAWNEPIRRVTPLHQSIVREGVPL
jgi:predicted nucleotidyltransferase